MVLFVDVAVLSRKYLKKADERGQCTIAIINPLHVIFAIFQDVLSNCVVDAVKVLTSHGMVFLGAV